MIWAIADLHFDHTKNKSMDIFGENWKNHQEKIAKDWQKKVKDDDTVLIAGDISWGMRIADALPDLELISSFAGNKIFLKGNHDYWWSGINKLNALNLPKVKFLQIESIETEEAIIFGTRGWACRDSEDFSENDEKIFKRELIRLELSFKSYTGNSNKPRICMIHYPPFNNDKTPNEFFELMKKYKIDKCIYGHLHGDGHKLAIEGNIDGIDLYCTSSDYLDFKLLRIL